MSEKLQFRALCFSLTFLHQTCQKYAHAFWPSLFRRAVLKTLFVCTDVLKIGISCSVFETVSETMLLLTVPRMTEPIDALKTKRLRL